MKIWRNLLPEGTPTFTQAEQWPEILGDCSLKLLPRDEIIPESLYKFTDLWPRFYKRSWFPLCHFWPHRNTPHGHPGKFLRSLALLSLHRKFVGSRPSSFVWCRLCTMTHVWRRTPDIRGPPHDLLWPACPPDRSGTVGLYCWRL